MWGYSLAFSPATYSNNTFTGVSWYGGDLKANAYIDVTARPVGIQGPDSNVMTGPKIPEMVYVFYQGMFACFT
jgi:Amt family ammonium transporter